MKLFSTLSLTVLGFGFFASQVRAASETELLRRLIIGRTFDDVLLPRQSSSINPSDVTPSDIPSECQSQCAVAVNALDTCTTYSCICTSANANGLVSCMSCIVSLDPEIEPEAVSTFSSFNAECADISGAPTIPTTGVPSATGVSGSQSSSTGSGSGVKGSNEAGSDRVSRSTIAVLAIGILSLLTGLAVV